MKNLEKHIRKYRGTPFKLGGLTMDGFDCMGFIYRFYTDMGVDLPQSMGEVNIDNYAQVCLNDSKKTDKLLIEYYNLIGKEINPMEVLTGDAIIVRNERAGHLFPAIYGGNGIGVAVFLRSCVRSFAIGKEAPIIKARRLL